MSINIAVLKETAAGEKRVALDPSAVKRLLQMGANVLIQSGAGLAAQFDDASYAGAQIIDQPQAVLQQADVLLCVQAPRLEDVKLLKPNALVISFIYGHLQADLVKQFCAGQISCLAMELIPRITRAQAMDALSSQATIAGNKAAIMAADLSPRLFPMLTTAAGTLRPAKLVVIGAGVAGLQAIATARRLGAQVEAYDIRPAAREQVESLGAKMIDTGVSAEGQGGYARELTAEEKQQQADVLAKHIAKAHAVISTAAIPGRPAPKIITAAMVDGMQRGSVIIDLAAETGGNCELTRPGETVEQDGKLIHGPLNVPSMGAVHASEMYAKNLLNLLALLIKDGALDLPLADEVIKGCLLTHAGQITHQATAKLLEGAQ